MQRAIGRCVCLSVFPEIGSKQISSLLTALHPEQVKDRVCLPAIRSVFVNEQLCRANWDNKELRGKTFLFLIVNVFTNNSFSAFF